MIVEETDHIHTWFELSYAQYLTIPRSVLQSMPPEWQARFVQCLEELDEAIDWRPEEGRYWVRLKDSKGRFVEDPLMDYERGRRAIPMRDHVRERAVLFAQLLNQGMPGSSSLPPGYPPMADEDALPFDGERDV